VTCNHDAVKSCPDLWFRCEPCGVLPGCNDDGDDDRAFDLSLRNCRECHSTISLPLATERRWLAAMDEKRVVEIQVEAY